MNSHRHGMTWQKTVNKMQSMSVCKEYPQGNKANRNSGQYSSMSKIKCNWNNGLNFGVQTATVAIFVNWNKKLFSHFCHCPFTCHQNDPLNFQSNNVVVKGVCFGHKVHSYSGHWPNLWQNKLQLTELIKSVFRRSTSTVTSISTATDADVTIDDTSVTGPVAVRTTTKAHQL